MPSVSTNQQSVILPSMFISQLSKLDKMSHFLSFYVRLKEKRFDNCQVNMENMIKTIVTV